MIVHMEYTGRIPELQGKTALVTGSKEYYPQICPTNHVAAQFDDAALIFNGHTMGHGWWPFLKGDFSFIGKLPVFADHKLEA